MFVKTVETGQFLDIEIASLKISNPDCLGASIWYEFLTAGLGGRIKRQWRAVARASYRVAWIDRIVTNMWAATVCAIVITFGNLNLFVIKNLPVKFSCYPMAVLKFWYVNYLTWKISQAGVSFAPRGILNV